MSSSSPLAEMVVRPRGSDSESPAHESSERTREARRSPADPESSGFPGEGEDDVMQLKCVARGFGSRESAGWCMWSERVTHIDGL